MHLGGVEPIIVLVIVVLLFGVSRIGKIGRELGTGIREFKSGLSDETDSRSESE